MKFRKKLYLYLSENKRATNYPDKMEITFDEHGLIQPKEIIEISVEKLHHIFVEEREEKSYREKLFQRYLTYTASIEKNIGKILFQFVNGSFSTLKEKPKDIDLVSFIHYSDYKSKQAEIELFLSDWENVVEIDGFIAPFSYSGHPHFIESQLSYEYWKSLYSFTRKQENGQSLSKGLIKINFYDQ